VVFDVQGVVDGSIRGQKRCADPVTWIAGSRVPVFASDDATSRDRLFWRGLLMPRWKAKPPGSRR